jgi:hypothetical protein
VKLRLGALSPSIAMQLKSQGISLPLAEVQLFQRQADAITLLNLHGVQSDGQARLARKRLTGAIAAMVRAR